MTSRQGLVTCVKRDHRGEEAHVVISDLKNVKIKIPWAQAQQYLIGKAPSESAIPYPSSFQHYQCQIGTLSWCDINIRQYEC